MTRRWFRVPRVGVQRAVRVLILFGLAFAIFLAVGRSGFNITDEGLVLDWSYRILHGGIPHRDIMTVHIQGSGIVHILDLVAPTPVLATSRLVAICEVVAYSALLAAMTFRTPFHRWGVLHIAMVGAATAVNLNTFPIMAWYTIDGILLCSLGVYVLVSGRPSPSPLRIAVAMLLVGSAALMKQSFAPAIPLAALAVAVVRLPAGWRRCLRDAVVAGAAATVPLAVYAAWVGAAGGWSDMVRQLTSATPVWGEQFFTGSTLGPAAQDVILGMQGIVVAVGLAFAAVLVGSQIRMRGFAAGKWLQRAGLVVGGSALALTVTNGGLGLYGVWGLAIEEEVLVALACQAIFRRRFDGVAFWFLALGWMVSLSYGPANNNLVAGSIALLILERLWSAAHSPGPALPHPGQLALRRVREGLVVVAVLLLMSMAYGARQANPYRDLPPNQQTSRPEQINSAYAWIETGAPTMAFLRQVDDCIAAYPATRISIVPDLPAQHVVYNRPAALPVTLLEPNDYRGSETQILDSALSMDAAGDYLILFQSTWDGQGYYKGMPATTSLGTPVWDYGDHAFFEALEAELTGDRHVCGSLIAVYKPPSG